MAAPLSFHNASVQLTIYADPMAPEEKAPLIPARANPAQSAPSTDERVRNCMARIKGLLYELYEMYEMSL